MSDRDDLPSMNTVMRHIFFVVLVMVGIVFLMVVLVGCGSDTASDGDSTSTTGTTTGLDVTDPDVRGQVLVTYVRGSDDFPDFVGLSDEWILKAGHLVCTGFDSGLSFLANVGAMVEGTDGMVDALEASRFIGASTQAFCPQYAYLIGE